MLSVLAASVLSLAIGAAPIQIATSVEPPHFRQLAELWALLRYRHPWVAYRSDSAVDSGTVAALATLRQSTQDDSSFYRTVARILSSVRDPATRVDLPTVPVRNRWQTGESASPPATRRTDEGTVIIALHDYRWLSNRGQLPDYDQHRLRAIDSALADARAAIIDVRTDETRPLPAGDDDVGVVRDFIADILSRTTTRRLTPPGARYVVRRYFSERNGPAPAEFRTTQTRPTAPAVGARDIPVILIVNEHSVLPRVAAALVRDGLAAIVAEGELGDAPFAPFVTQWIGRLVAKVRIADIVDADGRAPPQPTAVVQRGRSPADDPAMTQALKLALQRRPFSVRRGAALPVVPLGGVRASSNTSLPSSDERRFALLKVVGVLSAFYPDFDTAVTPITGMIGELLPRLDTATTIAAYHAAVATLTHRLRDSHSNLNTAELTQVRGPARLPVLLEIVEGRLTVVDLSHDSVRAGTTFSRGDVIVSIDGEDAIANGRRIAETYSSSTPWRADLDAERSAGRGPVGSTATIVVEDSLGRRRTMRVRRVLSSVLLADIASRTQPAIREIAPGVGYMSVGRVSADGFSAAFARLATMRGIIFDWRIGGANTWEVVSRLLSPDAPDAHPSEHFRGAAVVILDASAQSVTEVNADLLRRLTGTAFVGGTTSGTRGGVGGVTLPGGIYFEITSNCIRTESDLARCVGPDRKGLQPNVAAVRTRAGVRDARDEVLDAALRQMDMLLRR